MAEERKYNGGSARYALSTILLAGLMCLSGAEYVNNVGEFGIERTHRKIVRSIKREFRKIRRDIRQGIERVLSYK